MSLETKEAVTAGVIGGAIAALLCILVNHFLVPFPETVMANTIGHGISGLLSGLMSGFIGVMVALKNVSKTRPC